MPDMIAPLYALPDLRDALASPGVAGVEVRPALVLEREAVAGWVRNRFAAWTAEVDVCFSRLPPSCHIAVKSGEILGFACYDGICRNFFGPMGVDERARSQGVGRALLLSVLHAQRAQGYAYAVIGGVGPADFYARAVGATVIPGSDRGIYGSPGAGRPPFAGGGKERL
ncbi:MAG: GNAT family N-acetyltransferase [Alphaproteobacteria bacterium]|nr:GNAT family N-acetyltransferase [Alphaproteobacteria bacterium]